MKRISTSILLLLVLTFSVYPILSLHFCGDELKSLNIGLMLMLLLSLLPVGLMQTVASVKEGMWYARSAEFMQQPLLNVFKWLRTVGDTIFAIGSLTLFWFVFQLTIKKKREPNERDKKTYIDIEEKNDL